MLDRLTATAVNPQTGLPSPGFQSANEGVTSPVFNHYNSRGDVVSQANTGGGVEWEAKYEAFGTRTQEAGAPVGRQRANTKDEDLTGLLNEGMRYRDLEADVFITRDIRGRAERLHLCKAESLDIFRPVGAGRRK